MVERRSRSWITARRRCWHHTPPRVIQSSGPRCATTASTCSTAFCTVSTLRGRRLSPTIPSQYSDRNFLCSAVIKRSADRVTTPVASDVMHNVLRLTVLEFNKIRFLKHWPCSVWLVRCRCCCCTSSFVFGRHFGGVFFIVTGLNRAVPSRSFLPTG